jgi:hypothetical protein
VPVIVPGSSSSPMPPKQPSKYLFVKRSLTGERKNRTRKLVDFSSSSTLEWWQKPGDIPQYSLQLTEEDHHNADNTAGLESGGQ